jgi:hypothetical protein
VVLFVVVASGLYFGTTDDLSQVQFYDNVGCLSVNPVADKWASAGRSIVVPVSVSSACFRSVNITGFVVRQTGFSAYASTPVCVPSGNGLTFQLTLQTPSSLYWGNLSVLLEDRYITFNGCPGWQG